MIDYEFIIKKINFIKKTFYHNNNILKYIVFKHDNHILFINNIKNI